MDIALSKNYGEILQLLKDKIKSARLRATIAVNNELLSVYWEIGDTINKQELLQGWGTKTIEKLAADLKIEFEDMKGLSSRNLRYMRNFALAYPQFTILQQSVAKLQNNENETITILQRSVAKLPWGHICSLLDRLKEEEERNFYIQKAVENGWTRNMLVNQIESGLYKRQGALTNNFQLTLPSYESELAKQLFKDPYHLDFVMLGAEAKERDLENALMNHITKLLLELGDGFAFMGRQKKFEAGGREFFIDLLFYNTKLRRHIIIDLKIGDFEAEFVSKMNLYLGLADDTLRGQYDEPSIGLILCKTNNKIVAEYALRDSNKPIGIAEYKIAQMLPDDIRGELPTIAEIEEQLDEEIKEIESPIDARLRAVKEKLKNINADEIQTPATYKILNNFYHEELKPLYHEILEKLKVFEDDFFNKAISWTVNSNIYDTIEKLSNFWDSEENSRNMTNLVFDYKLYGFKKAGTENYNASFTLTLAIHDYYYSFNLERHDASKVFLKKLYHQKLSNEDKQLIITLITGKILDNVEWIIGKINEV
jgi:predicted nuclease of restriction endonuclease-like (RecB) superfamily